MTTKMPKNKCGEKCEIFSRVVGYFRPVNQWNLGKQEEFRQRKSFDEKKSLNSKHGILGKPSQKIL
ncbi:anaerobic ribonucleoside-triphosphate reductase [Candidatus Woesearchaeota archaeon]|nr:anaerobic ribonucleoside-triphosphate reductase [Candidatus Woesearchaeota archaeon]